MAEGEQASTPQPEQPPQVVAGDTITPGAQPAVSTMPTDAPAPPQVLPPTSVAIPPQGPDGSIRWTASEFIAHQKTAGWYVVLASVAVVLAAAIWLLTKDTISTAVVVIGAALFGVYAARSPRQLQYQLDDSGLGIGQRHFGYHEFRSFAVVPEGAFNSIIFMPLKRFAPLITIYYDPADEEKIVSLLSIQLPLEHWQRDPIDRLMARIRF